MPDRWSYSSLNNREMSERKFSANAIMRSNGSPHSSFNSRLGANGPAGSACEKVEKQNHDRVLEDTTSKFATLSTSSLPVQESSPKKSFNDRLSKARSTGQQDAQVVVKLAQAETEPVISNGAPAQLPREETSVDDIISHFIKEVVPSKVEAPKNGVSPPDSETMSKRDHQGALKVQEKVSTDVSNGSCESVIKEEPALELDVSHSCSSPQPKQDQDRKHLRRSDINQPKRSESPPCSAEKILRRDSPTSLGSGYERRRINEREVSCTSQPKEQDKKYSRRSDTYQAKRSGSPVEKFNRQDCPTAFGSGNKRRSFYDCEVVEEVENYFKKRFVLSENNGWKLPEASQVFTAEPWEVKELIECKGKLNAVKEKLNDLQLREWHAHTKRRNKAGTIVWKLRKVVNPEFPTQAWCKFYENVCTFNLVPEKAERDKMLNSVHLCEAPGAFITSLNHYIRTNYVDDFQWNWLGTTLNPHYEGNPLSLMINEDRFILHSLDHWTFGEDQSGDLMAPPNVDELMEKCKEMGPIMLVTADGSIDCQDDPGEQENYVAWLHFCEAFSAVMVLAEGGNFLLKMFTMFEHMTVCLLYLLSCVFEEVIINKPATSKEGNSETYAVCKNFAGKEMLASLIPKLNEQYGPNIPRKALFPKEAVPETFLESIIECAETFRQYQSGVIEANLDSFKHPCRDEKARNESMRRGVEDEFFRRYRLKELPDRYDIVGRHLINKMETYNMDPRLEVGSFSDRLRRAEVSDLQKMLDLKEDIERLDRQVLEQWPANQDIWWYEFVPEPGHSLSKDMKISTGKPVKRINSSKFCLGRLLDIRNKVREIILESKVVKLHSINSVTEQLLKVPHASSVLDFKNALWASSDAGLNSEEEHKAFKKIIEEFDKLSRDDNLVIYGYPLLTQFNVGLVYLLAHSFERVALTRPKGQNFAVIFEKHDVSSRKFKVKEKLDEIDETIESGRDVGKTVLAMLPIEKLCMGDFYKYITMANNICVKEQVLELIDEYLKAVETKEEREERRRTIF